MPSIEENKYAWGEGYDWPQHGDEWSSGWGGPKNMWLGTIYPRIFRFLPAETILEIAPGHGRVTNYLKEYCAQLTVVDIAESCIEACKERFASNKNIEYFVNDGKSLDMIPDQSIDLVVSYDSLVHAEHDVLQAYLKELSKKLRPNGVGFIHHSNLGSYRDKITGQLLVENSHWRGATMSAELFETYCNEVGLQCIFQEVIPWEVKDLTDCFSTFTKKDSIYATRNTFKVYYQFEQDKNRINRIAQL